MIHSIVYSISMEDSTALYCKVLSQYTVTDDSEVDRVSLVSTTKPYFACACFFMVRPVSSRFTRLLEWIEAKLATSSH